MTAAHFKWLTVAAALLTATPAAAQTAPASTFDGKYAGVSLQVFKSSMAPGGERYCRVNNDPPSPLMIANGTVRSLDGVWGGTINPQGGIVLHNDRLTRMDAQLDGQGEIRGQVSGYFCSSRFVWRRQNG